MKDLSEHFESGVIKDIFDNIRNVIISSAVLVSGYYLSSKVSPKAIWSGTAFAFGCVLILVGLVLFIACALDGHYKISKLIKKPLRKWPAVVFYLFLAVIILASTLHSNGVTI
ncbi:hypothetical protein D3C78_739680 [compost metagenome]